MKYLATRALAVAGVNRPRLQRAPLILINRPGFDARTLGSNLPDGEPASIQDRAYTLPICYTPDQ